MKTIKTKTSFFYVVSMNCSSCVTKIGTALLKVPGVTEVVVNLIDKQVKVSGKFKLDDALSALEAVGYPGKILDKTNEISQDEKKKTAKKALRYLALQAVVALMVGLLILIPDLLSGVVQIYPELNSQNTGIFNLSPQGFWLVLLIITLATMIFSGNHFYKSAWRQFKHRQANMDTLIALGTGAAWIYSFLVIVFSFLLPKGFHQVYLDASVLILAFVNLGHLLETKAKGKTSEAIEKLMDLKPKTAFVIKEDKEVETPISALQIGDIISIKPGSQIPIDGIVIEGSSYIDESMLTGESKTVLKEKEASVFQGTINQKGHLLVKVNQKETQTQLAKIIDLVKNAQNTKPQIARLVDRIAGVFVPIVLGIAFISFAIWLNAGITHAIIIAISILVIACPCALGLATPIAMMIGMGKAAENGILIRNGQALQLASQLDYIVFDKTGTLTEGTPKVTDVYLSDEKDQSYFDLVYFIEKKSEHPLALAICQYIEENNLFNDKKSAQIEHFKSITGQGVKATAKFNNQNVKVFIGNQKLMLNEKLLLSEVEKEKLTDFANSGKTPVILGIDKKIMAIFAISDPIRLEAKDLITSLNQSGIKTAMISGDIYQTANFVAKSLGIDTVYAEVLPEDKSVYIRRLQSQEYKVAMVGDGINDAPALAQATVGFAIGSGTDIAIESADITLVGHELKSISNAVLFSKKIMRNIKQSLFGAFIYNIIAIPVAAGILYPFFGILLSPIIASIAMALSSVTVVLNALRLRRLKAN